MKRFIGISLLVLVALAARAQTKINPNQVGNWNGFKGQACGDTSGSGTAQHCTTAYLFTPATPNCIVYTTTTPNSGTGLTVNVNSLGAKSVAVEGSSGWTTTLVASSSIPANKPIHLCYDGTNWDASGTGFQGSPGRGGVAGITLGTFSAGTGPSGVAVDASGNVWVANYGSNNVTKLSSAGALLGTFSVGTNPIAVAIDTSGNVWVANYGSSNVTELSSAGALLGTLSVGTGPHGMAIDASGNVWIANYGSNNVTKLSSAGALLGTFSAGTNPVAVAIDASGNVWVANYGSNNMAELSSAGITLGTFSAGTGPNGVAIDASGNVWVANYGSNNVTELSNSAGGYRTPFVVNLYPLFGASAGGGGGALAGVNSQTTSYTAVSGDNSKAIPFNCSAACSLTLPTSVPANGWTVFMSCEGLAPCSIVPTSGSSLFNAQGTAIGTGTINPGMSVSIWSDGTNYHVLGEIVTGSNVVPVFVQSTQNSCGFGPCTITLPTSVTPGDALIFECMHGVAGDCNVTPTDVQGDTFVLTNSQLVAANFELRQFVACGAAGGPTIITSASGGTIMAAYEVSNVALSACVDAYNSGQNTSNNATQSTGSLTTAQPYDFIFVSGATRTGIGGSTMTEANGYTAGVSSGLIASALTYNSWYGVKPGAGSVSDTVSYSPTAGGEYAGILALKPLGSSAAIGHGDLIVGGPDGQLQALHPGTAGNVLTSNGPGAMPSYQPSAGGSGALTRISQSVVSGSSTISITFSSIAQTYTDLTLVINGQSASSGDYAVATFNSDAGSHYNFTGMNPASSSTMSVYAGMAGSNWFVANLPSSGTHSGGASCRIFDYTNAVFNKNFTCLGTQYASSAYMDVNAYSGEWFPATPAAITSITITLHSGSNFVAGTKATLYGVQ